MSPSQPAFDAVLFDFGGVVTTSPFDNFAGYERHAGLPEGLIRSINSSDPDTNAWARFERGELDADGFRDAFEAEARARGHEVDGAAVIDCLSVDLRPEMVEALRAISSEYATAMLTNNFLAEPDHPAPDDDTRGLHSRMAEVLELFDVVIESSKVGVRKPTPRFYELACEALEVTPQRCVFLDDLGINLKPARAMGMTTIKVTGADQAIADLEATLGITLR